MSDRPLRILHLTAGSDAGGLSRYIYDLSLAMHERGYEIIVAGERGAWHWLFENAPFRWIEVPLKGGYFALRRSARVLREAIDLNSIDVIHAHYRRATLVARCLQRDAASARPIPLLYTLHLSHISLRFPWSLFTDFGDHTHVASEEARDWLIEDAHVPSDRITLIPHGIVPEKFPLRDEATRGKARDALQLKDEDLVAAYVGRLDDPKNVEWLVHLALAARNRIPNLRILIAGEGPHENQLKRLIETAGFNAQVRLLGHREPLPIYQAADALLLPSSREGFSLVTAEAMSVGVPVFRTRTSGTKGLICEGVTGKSVPIDRDGFISGAIDFLSDREALNGMGPAAAAHVREHFTFDRQLAQTIELYRRLGNDRPSVVREGRS